MAQRLTLAILLAISGIIWWWSGSVANSLAEKTLWYQMIWQGENVGYMREEHKLQGEEFHIRSETRVKTISQGQPFEFRETKLLVFETEKPFKLLRTFYRYEAPGQLRITELDSNGLVLSGTKQDNQELTHVNLPYPEVTLATFRILNDWIAEGPAVDAELRVIMPEITKAEVIETNYKITATATDLYYVSHQSGGQSNERGLEIAHDGEVSAYRFGSVIELVQVDNKEDLVLAGDVDLYRSKLLALDKPIGKSTEILTIRMQAEPWLADFISQDNRQQLSGSTLTLTANVSAIAAVTSPQQPVPLRIKEQTRQQLLNMARGAIGAETDNLNQLTALREYVSQYLTDGARVSVTSIESLLAKPEGDCTEHTQLFNALASVLGYQTRTVNGLVYLGDSVGGFAGHQWSEVYIDGYWLSFDPTWNINSLTATHIRLRQDKAASLYRYIKTATKPTLTLLDLE